MSPRSFHRAYTKAMGVTPARMVARTRVEAARQKLEDSELTIAQIARSVGFGNEEHMRRSFHRELGVSPRDYRQAWGSD